MPSRRPWRDVAPAIFATMLGCTGGQGDGDTGTADLGMSLGAEATPDLGPAGGPEDDSDASGEPADTDHMSESMLDGVVGDVEVAKAEAEASVEVDINTGLGDEDTGAAADEYEITKDVATELVDTGEGTAGSDVAADAMEVLDVVAPDTGPAACPIGATATSSHPTLVPMPVKVQLTASFGGQPCQCQWASVTPAVCSVSADGTATKVGDGTCNAHCNSGGVVTATVELKVASQWVIYYVGGVCEKAAWAETIPCGAKLWRWRTSDQAWDVDFSQLPEARGASPVVFARGHDIWVGGGGSYGLGWDPFTQAGAWGKDSVAPKCKEALSKDLGGTAEEYTCRAFRRLNLDTGEWDSPFEWKHPRSQTLYTDTGGLVWLSNGATLKGSGFPLPWAGEVIDPDGQVTYNMAIPATATYWPQAAPSALWGDAIVQGSYSTLAMLDAKTLTKFQPFPDPDWPCKWDFISNLVTFPGTNTLLIYGGDPKSTPCPANPYIDPKDPMLGWFQPLIYTPGTGWTVGDPLPSYLGKFVAAGDKLYFAATGGIARLDSPTAKWVWVAGKPKPPIYRTGYNVVAVWQ